MKVKIDDDIVNVSLFLSQICIEYFRGRERFYNRVIDAVGEDKWCKFLDFFEELIVNIQEETEANNKVIDIRKYKRTKK